MPGYFSLCSLPAGASITIDGVLVPWDSPLCPFGAKNFAVSPDVYHDVVFRLPGYEKYETSASISENNTYQVHVILNKIPGTEEEEGDVEGYEGTATLRVTAHDGETGKELHARPSVSGTGMESRYVTPFTINISIPKKYSSKVITVSATYPGYEKPDPISVTVQRRRTTVADVIMYPVRIWKEVAVVEKMPRIAWVTSVTLPSIMAWGQTYSGTVRIVFTESTSYRAHLDLLPVRGPLTDPLPSRAARISTEQTGFINPWENKGKYSLKWNWTCERIPERVYTVLCILEYLE